MQRQEKVLVKAREEAKDTQSLLKRSKKLINYFFRQLMTDKLICTFMIIIVLAVLAIAALGAYKQFK